MKREKADYTSPQTAMFTGEQMKGTGQLNMLDQIEATTNALPVIKYGYDSYFIDFRLKEIRRTDKPFISMPFEDMNEDLKAKIRGIRAEQTQYGHIPELDN
jgi:hypothetical protein